MARRGRRLHSAAVTPRDVLTTSLQDQRDAVPWKLDGLDDRAVRMPVTPTGTNLLGLVKHLAGVEFGYFGEVFGRPPLESMPWAGRDDEPNVDMWATAEESRDDVIAFYRRAWAHADATIAGLDLDAPGHVRWWRPESRDPTLCRVLVHVIAETARHAGHADVVRELLDGRVGLRPSAPNLPDADAAWWQLYVARLRGVAEASG